MTWAFVFWLLMLLWLVFAAWRDWPNRPLVGGHVLQFALFFILGWQVFGPPIR